MTKIQVSTTFRKIAQLTLHTAQKLTPFKQTPQLSVLPFTSLKIRKSNNTKTTLTSL